MEDSKEVQIINGLSIVTQSIYRILQEFLNLNNSFIFYNILRSREYFLTKNRNRLAS